MPLSRAPTFHPLRIRDIRRETADCVSIAFAVPGSLHDAYRFVPGQYLTLRTLRHGEELRRSYSLCTRPDAGDLRVAVKRVPDGRFSEWANTQLRLGDTIDVMMPMGRFGSGILGDGQTYVAIASGSGITPVMSIMSVVLADEPRSRFILLYGNRTSADIMFRDTIENLKDTHLGSLAVLNVLSRERQDLPALNGRIDADLLRRTLPGLAPIVSVDHVLICGPHGMAAALTPALRELGVADTRIQCELFTPAPDATAYRPTPTPPDTAATADSTVTAILGGRQLTFTANSGEGLIDAALRAGIELPFSCKGGMCCTCRAKLLQGTVRMDVNYSLEPWELAAGYVLTCQSRPTSPHVSVDYDQT